MLNCLEVIMNTDIKKEIISEIVELANRVKKLRHLVKPTPYQIRKEKKKLGEPKKAPPQA